MKYKKRANKYIKKDLRMFFKFNNEYNKKQDGNNRKDNNRRLVK